LPEKNHLHQERRGEPAIGKKGRQTGQWRGKRGGTLDGGIGCESPEER